MTLAVSIAQGGSNNVTMRNRIINGAMQIAQYGAGPTAVTTSSSYLTLDRYIPSAALTNGVITMAQASSNPPIGFTNYMSFATVSGLSSLAAGDLFGFQQRIEGYNIADLGFGTANAKPVTLSFWVYSSVTGTYGGAFRGASFTREYVFSYTITSANTWQYVTITIPGDTTGSWLTNNGMGLSIFFCFGSGSTYTGATGSWIAGGGILAPTGQANAVTTTGNVFNITGVQLEAGTTATPFEQRLYGTELALCQRYLPAYIASSGSEWVSQGVMASATVAYNWFPFQVPARVPPTGLTVSALSHFYGNGSVTNLTSLSAITADNPSIYGSALRFVGTGGTVNTLTGLFVTTVSAKLFFTGCEL